MEFQELKKSLTTAKKIYLLEGEETFFRMQSESMIKKAFLQESDFNLTNISGATLAKGNVTPLVDAIEICPFMGDYRLVVVDEWYPTDKDFKNAQLANFFNSDIDFCIVIINNKSKSDVLKKQKSVETVNCSKATETLCTRYIAGETARAGVKISEKACGLIIEYTLCDMLKVSMEIKKLITFAQDKGEITAVDVENMVTKDIDYKIYEVVNFIAEKKKDKAYEILTDIIRQGNQQLLITSLYYYYRRLLYVSACADSDLTIANALSVKEYAIKMARKQAKMFNSKRLLFITNKLFEYDYGFKSGKILIDSAVLNAVFMIMTEE